MILPASGILLIAEPFLKDPAFMRSVVLLCRHENEEGSFGFVLNNSLSKKLDELLPVLAGFDWPVYKGGPVQPDTLHYVHQYPELLPESVKLSDQCYWGGDYETLRDLILEGRIHPEKIKFFLGYSGWSEGQLADEIAEHSWVTAPPTNQIIFDTPPDGIWKASMIQLGGKYEQMIHYPTDPQLN